MTLLPRLYGCREWNNRGQSRIENRGSSLIHPLINLTWQGLIPFDEIGQHLDVHLLDHFVILIQWSGMGPDEEGHIRRMGRYQMSEIYFSNQNSKNPGS